MTATGGDSPAIVRVLLSAGAGVNATTNDGASALDISRVAAAGHRRNDAGRATANDDVADSAGRARRRVPAVVVPGLCRRRGVDSTLAPALPAAPHLRPALDDSPEYAAHR